MNSSQRRKFVKATMSELRKASASELERGLIDAAEDYIKQEKRIEQLERQLSERDTEIAKNAELTAEVERLKKAVIDTEEMRGATIRDMEDYRQQLAAAQEDITEMRADHLKLVEENHALRDQLATAEQRVAEACALTYLEDYDLTDIAERVRAGEWRKFMKGE